MKAVLFAALALALATQPPAKDAPKGKPERKLLEVVFTIRPQPLPTPLLPLTLRPVQLGAGDALPLYLATVKAAQDGNPVPQKDYLRAYEIMAERPPLEATAEELALIRKVVESKKGVIRLTERAVKIRRCDWSPLAPPPPAGLNSAMPDLLPTVQTMRELAQALSFRCYLNLAAKDYDAVLADATTMLGMAAHIGQGDTIIQFLVAVAINAIAIDKVRQVVNAGGAPNLYGPLSELPRPAIVLAGAGRRELGDLASVFPPVASLAKKAMTEVEAQAEFTKFFDRFLTLVNPEGNAHPAGLPVVGAAIQQKLGFLMMPDPEPTRQELAKLGYDAKLLAAMPRAQVYLLDATVRFHEQNDRLRLQLTLPEGHPLLAKPAARPAADLTPAAAVLKMSDLLAPAFHKCREAENRSGRETGALLVAEALRSEMAKPGAEWGAKLLDAPLVKAAALTEVTWNEADKTFIAPAGIGRRYVWKRGE